MSAACQNIAGDGPGLRDLRDAVSSDLRVRDELRAAAAEAASIPRLTVVDKTKLPASGDAHDYVSSGPYWWPDPARADGLPYLRRDGETNPASGGDRPHLEKLLAAVSLLTVMSRVESPAEYGRAAARLLRGWFLDPATRMNPHLRFAQGIPGICDGRGIGIIDTWGFCFLVEEVGFLEIGRDWTKEDLDGVKAWFASYLDWLLESPEGRQEGAEANNHGTWYDAQIVCFAFFCSRPDVARNQIEKFTRQRIDRHFEADGSQPHELSRTLSQTYCTFNLLAFACVARIGSRLGLDLWNWESPQGAQITRGVRWMLPYYSGEKSWSWQQISPFRVRRAALLLELAAEGTVETVFRDAARSLSSNPWDRVSPWEPVFHQS